MPEVQEVFRMATQKVRPDPGALERQHRGQRRRTLRRKAGVYALVAAFVLGVAVFALRIVTDPGTSVAGRPSPTPGDAGAATTIGTVTLSTSGCTLDLVDEPISRGMLLVGAVNDTDTRAAFDLWRIADGHTYEEFEARIEKAVKAAKAGGPRVKPGQAVEFSDLGQSGIIEAGDRGSIVGLQPPGTYGIVCLVRYEGVGIRPLTLVGPFTIR